MSKTFNLVNSNVLAHALAEVAQQPLDGSMSVCIKQARKTRRIAQNSLYHVWIKDISQHGETVLEVHERLRTSLLSHIYMRESQGPQQEAWVAAYNDILELTQGCEPEDAYNAMYRVVCLISTTWATVAQFQEYLEMIQHQCIEDGITLSHPDDYHYAMSGKK